MKLTKEEALAAKKSRTNNLGKKYRNSTLCKPNPQLNTPIILGQEDLEQHGGRIAHPKDIISPQVVSRTSMHTPSTADASTVAWPPAGILRQALMSMNSAGQGEKVAVNNTSNQDGVLSKISSSILNSGEDIKLVFSSTAAVPSTSESVSSKNIPLGSLCTGTFLAESLPLSSLPTCTLPLVSLGLPFGSFIHGPLLSNGSVGLPLISVSTSSLTSLSEISTISSTNVQKPAISLLTDTPSSISHPRIQSPIHSLEVSPGKVLPESSVITCGNQIIMPHFSQTQPSLLSKDETVKVVYSSIPKMEPCSLHLTQGIQKTMPLPPMSEVKSSLSSHLNVLTHSQNIEKMNKVSNTTKLHDNNTVTNLQDESENHSPVQFTSIPASSVSGSICSIKLDSSPESSSDFGHSTSISLPSGSIPIKFHSENSSSSDISSGIVIPVSNDMILTKIDVHNNSQDISHIVTIPLTAGTIYSNSLSIPMPLSLSGGGSSVTSSSVQMTSSEISKLSNPVSCLSSVAASSSVWSCSNSVPSITSETIQTTSTQSISPLSQTIPLTPVTSTVSSSNLISFTSGAISIPSSIPTTASCSVFATSGRSCPPQDPVTYTMQSPAEILSQLSKAGVLPAMSSSQVSSVLSALGSESHMDLEPEVTHHSEMLPNQVLQVDKVSTLTQTDDLELDEKGECPRGALDDSLMTQQVMHMLAQHSSETHRQVVAPSVPHLNRTASPTYPRIVAMVLNAPTVHHDSKVLLPVPDVTAPGNCLRDVLAKLGDAKSPAPIPEPLQPERTQEHLAPEHNLENTLLAPKRTATVRKRPKKTSSLRELLLGTKCYTPTEPSNTAPSPSLELIKQETADLSNKPKAKKPRGRPKKIKSDITNSNVKPKCNKVDKKTEAAAVEDNSEANSSIMEEVACYKCKFCPFLCLEKNGMTIHVQEKHSRKFLGSNEQRLKLKCPGCSNIFFATNSLEVHLSQDHQVVEPELKAIIESAIKISEASVNKHKQAETNTRLVEVTSVSKPSKESKVATKNSSDSAPNVVIDDSKKIRVRNLNSETEVDNPNNSKDKGESDEKKDSSREAGSKKNVEKLVVDVDPFLQHRNDIFNFRMSNLPTPIELIKTDDLALMVLNEVEEQKKETVVLVKKRGRPKGSKNESTIVGPNLRSVPPDNGEHSQDYRCNINNCAVLLRSHDNIEYHRRCHDGSAFCCPECAHTHTHWSGMSIHLWRCHVIDMELYACDQCGYKTNSFGKLVNLHKLIHGTERPFLCDSCGKGFKNRKQLRNHKAIHAAKNKPKQPKVGECEVCGRGFSNKRMLRMHLDNVHHKLRPHLCNFCGYSAPTVSGLKMHMRKHTGEKPFQCSQCDYCTSDHNSLRRHKMRHTGDKPYKCPHCTYACIQSSTYKAHLKTKHPGMDDGLMFSCKMCSFRSVKEENYIAHLAQHKTTKSSSSWPRKSRPKQNPPTEIPSNVPNERDSELPVIINLGTEIPPFSSTSGEGEKFGLDLPSESVIHLVDHLEDSSDAHLGNVEPAPSVEIPLTPEFEAEEITGDIREPQQLQFKVRKEEGQ